MLIAAAVLLLPCAAHSGDRVYRWVDKSGQENFTDSLENVPAQYRSKFTRDDDESPAKEQQGDKKKKGAAQTDGADAQVKGYQNSPQRSSRPQLSTPTSDQYDAELESKRQKQADVKKQMVMLNTRLTQKTDELNNAIRWETILHTPKYTQDKIRLMKEVDDLKAKIADQQKKLDEASKPMP